MTGRRARVFLGLGSNIEPEHHLPAAVALLAETQEIVGISHVWETAPVGFDDQPNFLNAAVLIDTRHSAEELCRVVCPEIERRLGRVRDPHNRNAPRTIDVDVALFGSCVCQIDHRRIPDPDILEREFLAICLAELDPDFVHPTDGRTLAEIAASLRGTSDFMRRRDDVRLRG